MAMLVCACNPQSGEPGPEERVPLEPLLSANFLLGNESLPKPFVTTAFTPPAATVLPADSFNGLLTLNSRDAFNGMETLVDTYRITGQLSSELASLPPFSYEYVSDGSSIVPVKREPQRSSHPYWEIILEPGRAWTDAADKGWSRAALPFAIKERNQNCTHNGLMTFLYRGDGSISRVAWQITSETCLYLKVNLWGVVKAEYHPARFLHPARSLSLIVVKSPPVYRSSPFPRSGLITRGLNKAHFNHPELMMPAFMV